MLRRFLLPLLLLALACGHASAAPPVIPEEVKTRVRQRVDNGYTPGIVVCMVNAEGRDCYSYGRTSHVPGAPVPDGSTLYEIASVTKTFTGVLLAQMVEAGEVSLSDTVGGFLPVGVNMPGNGGAAITLEQLANHTSGLPATPNNLPATITDFANQFENYTVQRLYDFLGSYTLPRAPGSAYEYSNTGMGLLGHVLALSQGTDYETLLRQRVLYPMGLFDTAIELDFFQKARVAPGHHGVVERPPFEMNSLRAAGGLKSCAFDLAIFLRYNLGLSTGPIGPALELSRQLSYNLPSGPFEQGLGWWLWDGGDVVQHGGDSFGSSAFIGFRMSTGTGVVVLSNNRAHFAASITDLGFHCLDQSKALDTIPNTTPVPEARLREIAGDYGVFRIEVLYGRPVVRISGQIDYTAYSNNANGLAVLDVGLDANMSFTKNPASGKVTTLTWTQNGGPPTPFARIRHPATLSIAMGDGANPITLEAKGEGDVDYPLEISTDLRGWQPHGSINIWSARREPLEGGAGFFRVREP